MTWPFDLYQIPRLPMRRPALTRSALRLVGPKASQLPKKVVGDRHMYAHVPGAVQHLNTALVHGSGFCDMMVVIRPRPGAATA